MSILNFKLFVEKEESASTIPDALAVNLNIPFKMTKKAWKAVGPTPISKVIVPSNNDTKVAIPISTVELDMDCDLEAGDDDCKSAKIKAIDTPNQYMKINGKNFLIPKIKQSKLNTLVLGGKKIDQLMFGNLIPALMQQPGQAGASTGAGPGTPPGGPLL